MVTILNRKTVGYVEDGETKYIKAVNGDLLKIAEIPEGRMVPCGNNVCSTDRYGAHKIVPDVVVFHLADGTGYLQDAVVDEDIIYEADEFDLCVQESKARAKSYGSGPVCVWHNDKL